MTIFGSTAIIAINLLSLALLALGLLGYGFFTVLWKDPKIVFLHKS